jgi:hypothetical protein
MSLISQHLKKIQENFEFSDLKSNITPQSHIPEISADGKDSLITLDKELLTELLSFAGLAQDKVEKILNKMSILNKSGSLELKHLEYLVNDSDQSGSFNKTIAENLKSEMNNEPITVIQKFKQK